MKTAPRALAACLALVLVPSAVRSQDTGGATARETDAAAQAAPERCLPRLEETVVVTATREEQPGFDVPRSVAVAGPAALAAASSPSALDAASGLAGIWVEKRTTTTSDPVVRGMSGVHVLALVGGNTLSTLWGEGGEGGDDMYGKVDPWSLERIEVVRGPGSVLYGPSALSGIVSFVPRRPPLAFAEGPARHRLAGRAQIGSNDDERRLRLEHALATGRYRSLLGLTWGRFGDAHDGEGRALVPSDGEVLFADYAGELRLGGGRELRANVQLADLDETKRYYRPGQTNFNDRLAVWLELRQQAPASFLESYAARVYSQHKKDRRLFEDERGEGTATTDTLALDLQLASRLGTRHRLTYGVQGEVDRGVCPDDEQFSYRRTDGRRVKDGPDSTWGFLGAYLQDEVSLGSRVRLTLGGRAERFRFRSTLDEAYLAGAPEGEDRSGDAVADDRSVWAASAGLLVDLAEGLRAFGSVARGYRVAPPSFGLLQLASGIKVPGGLLGPETSRNLELGLKARRGRAAAAVTVYRTDYRDFVDTVPGTFRGLDWYDWNRDGVRQDAEGVLVAANVGRARMTGLEAEAAVLLGRGFEASGTLDRAEGDDLSRGTPLRYGTPLRGTLRLAWREGGGRRSLELGSQLVDRFSRAPEWILTRDPTYRLDPQDPVSPLLRPDGRLPGYALWHLRGEQALGKACTLRGGAENLLGKSHRAVHSRMDGIGRNLWLQLEWRLDR